MWKHCGSDEFTKVCKTANGGNGSKYKCIFEGTCIIYYILIYSKDEVFIFHDIVSYMSVNVRVKHRTQIFNILEQFESLL
jgi:hypothetical protein